MDFMNLNQAAHGDREFGFIGRPAAARAQGRRRPLDRRPRSRSASAPGRARRARSATGRPAGSPASATTCARSRSPRATRSRRSAGSGFSVNTYGVGDLVAVVDEASDAEVDALDRDVPRRVRRRPGSAPGGERAAVAARRRPDRDRPAALPRGRRVHRRSPTTFEDLHGLTQLPGPRRPAADARRLRLRRRGRLEDRGDGPRDEGHVQPACRAASRSWRTTPTTSTDDGDLSLGAHMLEVCESIAGGAAAARDPSPRRSAARRTRSGSCSTPTRARRSPPRSSTWASGSGWSRPSSTSSPAEQPLPKLPVARAALAAAARPQDERGRGLDLRRRLAPHEPRLRGDARAPRGLRGDVRDRVPAHRRARPRSTASGTSSAGTTSTTSSHAASDAVRSSLSRGPDRDLLPRSGPRIHLRSDRPIRAIVAGAAWDERPERSEGARP